MNNGIGFAISRDGAVAELTFTDVASRNALNRATRTELVAALQRLDRDPDVRAIVVTGTDPAFSSGVDAKEVLATPDYRPVAFTPVDQLRTMLTPTIAAVNGACVSGALEIVIACSIVIASERAEFADTHARIGLTPSWGMTSDLPAVVGPGRARQLSLTGQRIDAQTALTWGLVNEVLPHASLLTRAREIARQIGDIAPASIENVMGLSLDGQRHAMADLRMHEREVADSWALDRHTATANFERGLHVGQARS